MTPTKALTYNGPAGAFIVMRANTQGKFYVLYPGSKMRIQGEMQDTTDAEIMTIEEIEEAHSDLAPEHLNAIKALPGSEFNNRNVAPMRFTDGKTYPVCMSCANVLGRATGKEWEFKTIVSHDPCTFCGA